MKILLVINKPEREKRYIDRIAEWITTLQPGAEILQCRFVDRDFLEKGLRFRPDVIFTFPMTAHGLSGYYYLLKHVSGAAVVTFDTEGAIGYYVTDAYIKSFVGFDRYGGTLVDFALYWGKFVADVLGEAFLREGKLSSRDRVGYIGYPEYEAYFSPEPDSPGLRLPEEMQRRVDAFEKQRRVIILTGFVNAEYTKQDCINAGDQFDVANGDYAESLERSLRLIAKDRERKQKWIDTILALADAHADALFIVKCHPLELSIHKQKNIDPYAVLRTRPNILLIEDSAVSASQAMAQSSLLVHYGSTVLAESYILKIPSVYVHDEDIYAALSNYTEKENHDQRDWPSTRIASIDGLPALIRGHLEDSPLLYDDSCATAQLLEDFFNIRAGREYAPTRDIAGLLLGALDRQPVEASDPYLLQAVNSPLGLRACRALLQESAALVEEGSVEDALACLGAALDLHACMEPSGQRTLLSGEIAAFSAVLSRRAKEQAKSGRPQEAKGLLGMQECIAATQAPRPEQECRGPLCAAL